jgi:hypothetical protein
MRLLGSGLLVSCVALSAIGCSTSSAPAAGSSPESLSQTQQAFDLAAVSWPSDAQWYAVTKNGSPLTDPTGDAQGSRDVVGAGSNGVVYLYSDAHHMYFRLRTGDDPKKTATTFGPFGWGCELDTNGDPSKYEFFANVNGIISGDGVQLLQNTTQKFDDPKDTAEVTLQTYSAMVDNVQTYADAGTPSPAHARVVTAGTTLGGNASDYFVDFAIDLNDIPGGFNPAVNAFRVICGSSNSANNLAADIVDGTQVDTLSAAA